MKPQRPPSLDLSLDAYLDRALRQPWRWGKMDCCFFAGDWIAAATGRDPMAARRGTYSTATGARRLIAENGGLLALADLEMTRAGFARTATPDHGDIAIIDLPDTGDKTMHAAGAALVIRHTIWWMARGVDGVLLFDAPVRAAWRVLA